MPDFTAEDITSAPLAYGRDIAEAYILKAIALEQHSQRKSPEDREDWLATAEACREAASVLDGESLYQLSLDVLRVDGTDFPTETWLPEEGGLAVRLSIGPLTTECETFERCVKEPGEDCYCSACEAEWQEDLRNMSRE